MERAVAGGDSRPTDQALAVKAELSSAIESELLKLSDVWSTRVPAINALIDDAGMSLVELPES